jgi:hypothetical protein
MKYFIVLCTVLFLKIDLYKTWGDDFFYLGKPNSNLWKYDYWGGGPAIDYTNHVLVTSDGHNLEANFGYCTLIAKKGYYSQYGIDPITKMYGLLTRPFSGGRMESAKTDFLYGYIETRIRMPDNYYTDLYGGYWDNGIWLYDAQKSQDIQWSELDYEIVTNGSDSRWARLNALLPNLHLRKPFTASPNDEPAHFELKKIDPDPTNDYYVHQYNSTGLLFNNEFHTFGYEWLPDQFRFYVDNKLWVKLDKDYQYTYTENGVVKTISPIHEFNLPMPIFLQMEFHGGNLSKPGPDELHEDFQYVRYYQLKTACGTDFLHDNYSNTDFYTQYFGNEIVYDNERFGLTGCTTCSDEILGNPNQNCGRTDCNLITLRAKDILFEDGFKVEEAGELYACDVDICH